MTRQFTAALLSLSLAFTSVSAAPARAAEDDLGKFIVGAIALLAIGKALEDQNKSSTARRTEAATARTKTYVQPTRDDRTWNDRNRWDDRFGRDGRYYDRDGEFRRDGKKFKKPKKLKNKRTQRALPAECFYRVRTRSGPLGVFSSSCLQRTLREANRLPDQCRDRIRTRRGLRHVYRAGCLRDYGYRVEARRH